MKVHAEYHLLTGDVLTTDIHQSLDELIADGSHRVDGTPVTSLQDIADILDNIRDNWSLYSTLRIIDKQHGKVAVKSDAISYVVINYELDEGESYEG